MTKCKSLFKVAHYHQVMMDGSMFFCVRGHKPDESRLIDRDGSHVKALTCLVRQMGKATNRTFTFKLMTTEGRSVSTDAPQDATHYDPAPIRKLLAGFLEALGVQDATIDVNSGEGPTTKLRFNFVIDIPEVEVAEGLTKVNDYGLTIIGALGTLFRAIANQQGVKFQVNLADRK